MPRLRFGVRSGAQYLQVGYREVSQQRLGATFNQLGHGADLEARADMALASRASVATAPPDTVLLVAVALRAQPAAAELAEV